MRRRLTLTQFVLASSCVLGLVSSNMVYAAPQTIAVDGPLTFEGQVEGVKFMAAATLTVADGQDIGLNNLGQSVTTTNVNLTDLEYIIFAGTSKVQGSIIKNANNYIDSLELQGGANTVVTLAGATELTSSLGLNVGVKFSTKTGSALQVNAKLSAPINFNAHGSGATVTFANNVDLVGRVSTTVANTGTVIFSGNSTVTPGMNGDTGLLGDANNAGLALLAVQVGSGQVYLNAVGDHIAKDFVFAHNFGSLKLANGANIVGNIGSTTILPSRGTLIFDKDSTVTGNIGALTPLSLITLSNAGVASTVTFTGPAGANVTVKADTIKLENTDGTKQNTLILTAQPTQTSTVNANITTAATSVGVVNLERVSTFTGNIGSSTLKLKHILVGEHADTTLIGNIYVDNLGVQFQGDNTFTVSDGNFIDGSVVTTNLNQGTLVFQGSSKSYGEFGANPNILKALKFEGGTFNLNHDIYATTVTVKNNATLAFHQDTKLSHNLMLDHTGVNPNTNLQVGTNKVTIGGIFTANNNSTITLDLNSSTKFGNLAVTGAVAFATVPVFDITTSGYIPNNGPALTIITSGVAFPTVTSANLKNKATLLSNFALVNNGQNLDLTVTRNTNASIADYPFTLGVAGALDALQETSLVNDPITANPDLFAVIDQLDNFTNRADFNNAIATLAPSVDGDNLEGMLAITRLGVETIRERLDSYRLGQLDYHHTGYAAGMYDPLKDYGVWVKLLASRLKQGEYKNIEGYKADITGISGGIDYTSPDNEVVYGLGFNYSTTDSLSRSFSASENTINSYSLMLYGTYNFNNPWYLDGILYLSNHHYEQNRHVKVGTVSRTAKSDYLAWQISARAETGFVYQYNQILFQPIVGLFYSHINRDSHTENGAGGLNLVNRSRDINSLRLSVGPKISSVLGAEGALIIPEMHAYYNFELGNSKEQIKSNFAIGGPIFETPGIEHQRNSYVVGVGVSAYGFENISCHIGLDYEFNNTNFSALHGSLKFKYTW